METESREGGSSLAQRQRSQSAGGGAPHESLAGDGAFASASLGNSPQVDLQPGACGVPPIWWWGCWGRDVLADAVAQRVAQQLLALSTTRPELERVGGRWPTQGRVYPVVLLRSFSSRSRRLSVSSWRRSTRRIASASDLISSSKVGPRDPRLWSRRKRRPYATARSDTVAS